MLFYSFCFDRATMYIYIFIRLIFGSSSCSSETLDRVECLCLGEHLSIDQLLIFSFIHSLTYLLTWSPHSCMSTYHDYVYNLLKPRSPYRIITYFTFLTIPKEGVRSRLTIKFIPKHLMSNKHPLSFPFLRIILSC